MQEYLKTYTTHLQQIYHTHIRDKIAFSEHSFRTPLENLLNALKSESIRIIHEPKSEIGQGSIRPDFKVWNQVAPKNALSYNALIGFIECKKWGEDLDKHIKGKQLDKYLDISPNIILTNYNRFILLSFNTIIYDVTLFPYGLDSHLFEAQAQANAPKIAQDFQALLNAFFTSSQTTIKSKEELVKILSSQSFYLAKVLNECYHQEPKTTFHKFFEKTYDTFYGIIKAEFSHLEFCDTLAQSIVYGMFVAHIDSLHAHKEGMQVDNIANLLPKELEVLSEFIYFSIPSFYIPPRIKDTLENIQKAVMLIDQPSIAKALNTKIESIAIYLYEDFLRAYDNLRATQKRKEGGVFYTPEPIVECIVRSLNSLLKTHFGKSRGFLDSDVSVLDFATGTGSFLLKVFEVIMEEEKSKVWQQEAIKDKFLKDIYGFEISFVPYIVAHLKLSAILKNIGFDDFSDAHKLQIFLTNTLDLSISADYTMSMPLVLLEEQDLQARKIKHNQPILVILGNPPYNNKSKNNLPEILHLLKTYKQGLDEKKINLDDDYIKFIRFAQWKLLERTNPNPKADPLLFSPTQHYGLMGFITNNSFLYGRTHRKMRQSLLKSFDEIYILNLHGDAKDTKEDQNVFDIRVGVCISIFIKYPNDNKTQAIAKDPTESKKDISATPQYDNTQRHYKAIQNLNDNPPHSQRLHYYSTADNGIFSRTDKFALLNDIAYKGLDSITWQSLTPQEPYFWFIPREIESSEYEDFWALGVDTSLGDERGIFENVGSGNKAERDSICIHFDTDSLKATLQDFLTLDTESIRSKYALKADSRDWSIGRAKDDVIHNKNNQHISPIAYRPFDTRYTFFSGKSKGFWGTPSAKISQHFLYGENIGLCFPKTAINQVFDYGLVVNTIADVALGGKNTGSETYIAPLYRYTDSQTHAGEKVKVSNFTPAFESYRATHKVLQDKTPEQILHFIYATLYHPTYRSAYTESLKVGFPRINFELDSATFAKLESIGAELCALHLLQSPPQESDIILDFRDNANTKNPSFVVEKMSSLKRYEEATIILNKDLCVKNVKRAVWEYTIGGYSVLAKWLGYRVNRTLSRKECEHFVRIACVLESTLFLQAQLTHIKLL